MRNENLDRATSFNQHFFILVIVSEVIGLFSGTRLILVVRYFDHSLTIPDSCFWVRKFFAHCPIASGSEVKGLGNVGTTLNQLQETNLSGLKLWSVTSNSRMAYAFSRDRAMPFSSVWHKVNKHEVPIYSVWISAFISFCMALTSLGSIVAFNAMVSIATIGLYIAYALPIFFRVTLARKSFIPGPFNLRGYGVLVGWIAVLWVVTISILFSLPVAYPITMETLNYTPAAVVGLFILTTGSWVASARHWFTGPVTNINP